MVEPGRADRNVAAAWNTHFQSDNERPPTLLDHCINGLAAGMSVGMALGVLALPLRHQFERPLGVQTKGAFWFFAMRSGALFGGASAVGIALLSRWRGSNDVVNPMLAGGGVGLLWQLRPRDLGGRMVFNTRSMLAMSTACGSLLCAACWSAVGRDSPATEVHRAPPQKAAAPASEVRDPWDRSSGSTSQ